jgi:peptidyl-prolyl cis-trans isomerase B (cyclophilin B)
MASKKSPLSKAAQERIKTYEARSNELDSRAGAKKRDNRLAVFAGVAALAIALGSQLGYAALHPKATASAVASPITSASAPASANQGPVPSKLLAENRKWSGSMKLNGVALNFELDGNKAPQAVASFVSLAKKGFFSGVTCHRITTAGLYVLQCGDPKGDGTGGPGYSFGPIENAPADNVYGEGVIAMARQGNNAASQGSQFFIVYKKTTLGADSAGGYTVFGKVTSGLPVVQAIAAAGTKDGSTDGNPKTRVVMTGVNVK